MIALAGIPTAAAEAHWLPDDKPRLFVLTNISNEPDDEESMVRLLVYANEFDLEGLWPPPAPTCATGRA